MNDNDKPLAYDAYQELADSYAEVIDSKPHNAYYDRPAMLGLLPAVEGKRVLDAGCGPGAYAEAIVRLGATVDAFDVSDRMLELAAERLAVPIDAGQVVLHNVDMTRPLTGFSDESFDVVNAPLCVDYIQDWSRLFAEFFRVLKPGGSFLFSAGHPSFDAEYFRTNRYFEVEQVKCTWKGFKKQIEMPSFRRSLADFVNPVLEAGFRLERLHEPLPTEDFKNADARRYKILMHRPGFLCLLATKPAAQLLAKIGNEEQSDEKEDRQFSAG